MKWNFPLTCGTVTGATFGLFSNMFWQDFVQTMLMASVGALISFVITYVLQRIQPTSK